MYSCNNLIFGKLDYGSRCYDWLKMKGDLNIVILCCYEGNNICGKLWLVNKIVELNIYEFL